MKAATPAIFYETVTFTPEMAAEIIDKHSNDKNRPLRQRKVDRYAELMKDGLWPHNGETIAFAPNGKLLNGHHRFWACVLAAVPFTTGVARNVPEETFKTMDGGAPRTGADLVHSGGTKTNSRPVATAAGLCLRYNKGSLTHNGTFSPMDLSDYYDAHPDLETFVVAASGSMRRFSAAIGAVTYLASAKYRNRALTFIQHLVDGTDLDKGDPCLALRDRLMGRGQRGNDKESTNERFRLIVLGWNGYIEERKMFRIQAPKTNEIPKIRGASK